MKKFRDWRLRAKLLVVSAILVMVVTALMLAALSFSFGQLSQHAIPDQRLILNLVSASFDYLSEIREYVVEAESETLVEIDEIVEQLGTLSREYGELNRVGYPRESAIAQRIENEIGVMVDLGERIVVIVDHGRQATEDASSAEDSEPEELNLELSPELEEVLEDLESVERRLSKELQTAAELARNEVAEASRFLFLSVFGAGLIGLVGASVLAFRMANQIDRSLTGLQDAARQFAAGERHARAPVSSSDEVGQLADNFNQMAAEIENLVSELETRLAELRDSQTQLVQSGKLVAVGELAAGVAHELNNPLSVVLTYSLLLQEKLDKLPEGLRQELGNFDERLDLVSDSAGRCKTIVENLLLFSRQDDSELSLVDLDDLLDRTFDLIGSQLRRHQVRVSLDVEPSLPPILGHFSQLQQVITNLALNAMQALPAEGELEVTAQRRNDIAELTVADDGPGIPEENLGRIFEPFFTTKRPGEGTGLGLSIVYGIVQSHGGEIDVESVVGRGTTFRIRLPFATEETRS